MALHGMKRGEAHLEIINTKKDTSIRIQGNKLEVIFAWMQMTVQIAEVVKIPLPQILAECAILGRDFEELNHCAGSCSINLSRPTKGGNT